MPEQPAPFFVEIPETDPPLQAVFVNREGYTDVFYNLAALIEIYSMLLFDAVALAEQEQNVHALIECEGVRKFLVSIDDSRETLALEAAFSL